MQLYQSRAFIAQNQNFIQLVYFVLIIVSLWVMELIYHPDIFKTKIRHTKVNMGFIATALPIQLFMVSIVLMVCSWTNWHQWGLIRFIPFHNNFWVYYLSLFVLLDLGEYIYHVIMHKCAHLWRFHLVHHSDLDLDVSTTLREHPVETFMRTGFLMLWVFLLGPLSTVLVLRQSVQTLSNIAAHSRVRLPKKVNKILGLIFVTPNLHHVHHHYQLPYTDSNYGDVLIIWDRLFGTYAELDTSDTLFGVDIDMQTGKSNSFWITILSPFKVKLKK